MKTTAMAHQVIGRDLLRANRDCYLLACEQGTGKTWMLMADAEDQFLDKKIDGLLVIAPKGVHTNWIMREIPAHMSIPVRAAYYSAGASRKIKNQVERLFRPTKDELTVLAINIDAINFGEGYSLAARFLKHFTSIIVIDESSRIKSMSSKRTQKAINLGGLSDSKRCASGTPITNAPEDIFSQFKFMSPNKPLLGTSSYRAFVAEYTELLPENNHVMRHIKQRAELRARAEDKTAKHFSPQIPVKGSDGRPVLRNLEKLGALLKPKMYRVLKKDCLDLPPKIFKTLYYDLTPSLQKAYDLIDEKLRYEENGEIDIFSPLTKQVKLQQVAAGFILRDDVVTIIRLGEEDETSAQLMPWEDNPRIELLKTAIEEAQGQYLIWARFRQEIEQIAAMLKAEGISFVEYHGGVKKNAREVAVDTFQSGAAQCFLGNPQSGGIGLTLTRATDVIYYSQSYNLEIRLQSEDRAHRIGTNEVLESIGAENVIYTDLCAIGTIDEKIITALQSKSEMASCILDGTPAPMAKVVEKIDFDEKPVAKKKGKIQVRTMTEAEMDDFLMNAERII